MSETPPGKHRAPETSGFSLGQGPEGGGLSTTAKIVIAIGLLVVAGLAVFLLMGQDEDAAQPSVPTEPASPSPASELACPLLEDAEAALDAGDEEAFAEAIRGAAQVAERTLDTSGEAFGPAERAAIELDFQLQGNPDSESLRPALERGLRACDDA